jgi:hypothetical protein
MGLWGSDAVHLFPDVGLKANGHWSRLVQVLAYAPMPVAFIDSTTDLKERPDKH